MQASSATAMNGKTQVTLLRRLRDGTDPLAWDEFFERYGRLLFVCARHRGCSEHTAEEIVQEVMLAVFQKRDVTIPVAAAFAIGSAAWFATR